VQRDHARAAVVVFRANLPQVHHRRFGRDRTGFAEVVAVEDVVADDDDPLTPEPLDQREQLAAAQVVLAEVAADLFIVERRDTAHAADQRGRGVDHLAAREDDAPAVADDGLALGEEAGVVVGLVLAPFDVNVGLELVEQFDSRRVWVDVDEIDALERGQALGAEVVRDQRAVGALVHLRVGGDGDDQDVALRARELEVVDVAGVDDVEAAVALHYGLAARAGFGSELQ
jgi:hypothetical protein